MENGMYGFNGSFRGNGGTALLEREETTKDVKGESVEEAKARMKSNLERLINYEKYEEDAKAEEMSAVEKVYGSSRETSVVSEQPAYAETTAFQRAEIADDDIRPTSTTLQFGNEQGEDIRNELREEKNDSLFNLSAKGKLAIVLYSVAVVIVMALIIINTGVLAALSNANSKAEAELYALRNEYTVISEKIESASSDSRISEIAEKDFGMIKR